MIENCDPNGNGVITLEAFIAFNKRAKFDWSIPIKFIAFHDKKECFQRNINLCALINWYEYFNIIIWIVVICKQRRKLSQNLKASKRKNREMLKLQKLSKLKGNKGDRLIKPNDKNFSKEFNNTKLIMLNLSNKQLMLEEMLNIMVKSMYQLLLKLPL